MLHEKYILLEDTHTHTHATTSFQLSNWLVCLTGSWSSLPPSLMWPSLKRSRQAKRNRTEIQAGPCPMVSQQLKAVRQDEVTPRASEAKSLSVRSWVVLLNFGSTKADWTGICYLVESTWSISIYLQNANFERKLKLVFIPTGLTSGKTHRPPQLKIFH